MCEPYPGPLVKKPPNLPKLSRMRIPRFLHTRLSISQDWTWRVLCWKVGNVSVSGRVLLEGEEPRVPALWREGRVIPALNLIPLNPLNKPRRKILLL